MKVNLTVSGRGRGSSQTISGTPEDILNAISERLDEDVRIISIRKISEQEMEIDTVHKEASEAYYMSAENRDKICHIAIREGKTILPLI